MTLPLRIELAMTFKAVFPDISGPGPIRTWASFRPAKRFRLQHTDFADLCQRFTDSRGRHSWLEMLSFRAGGRLRTRRSISFGLGIFDRLGVVVGEVGRH